MPKSWRWFVRARRISLRESWSAYRRVACASPGVESGADDWAEEVVQESFLAALRSCHTYDSQYSFRTWLWTIVFNQCKTHFQRRARWQQCESLPAAQDHEPASLAEPRAPSPLGQLLAKERSELLERLLGQLSAAQADALRLRFFGELKFQEIADTMGCSLNTAKNRVKWGLLRLADMINNTERLLPIDRDDREREGP